MLNILPNWHPVFVHFSIALYVVTVGLYILSALPLVARWGAPILTAARINLWCGAVISLATIAAGIHASLTVPHDAAQLAHIAAHRGWALATMVIWWLIAFFEIRKARQSRSPRFLFIALLVLALVPLAITGWKGGELVYRDGIGVLARSAGNL